MNIAIFAYSRQGCKTAKKIVELFQLDNLKAYTMEKFQEEKFHPIERPSKIFYGKIFKEVDAMIFVGSCGIAVREIAPHVNDKKTDPAVIVVDELGKFVIPVLSGHIGGANEIALKIADSIGSTPVITTATDINEKFSVDAWATKQGLIIGSMEMAKAVSATILEKDMPFYSECPVVSNYPNGVIKGSSGEIGIAVTYKKISPFEKTLHLISKILHIGIGCRRNTKEEDIEKAVCMVLEEYKIDIRAIKCVSSIDLKANEEGLLQFCDKYKLQINFYSASELNAVKGIFTSSDFVKSITGVDNVCERAALIDADRLIVKKTSINGVTVAVAEENMEVHFG